MESYFFITEESGHTEECKAQAFHREECEERQAETPTSRKGGERWGTPGERAAYGRTAEGGCPAWINKERDGRGMDISWLTERIAIGGGIWNAENMATLAEAGITHIIDMQIEFDDTPLAAEHGIAVLWNPTNDDFEAKPADLFQRGVDFASAALQEGDAKLFIHCAAGVHRAPMMALALLGSMGWDLKKAMQLIEERRPAADFTEVYVRSVERFLKGRTIQKL